MIWPFVLRSEYEEKILALEKRISELEKGKSVGPRPTPDRVVSVKKFRWGTQKQAFERQSFEQHTTPRDTAKEIEDKQHVSN